MRIAVAHNRYKYAGGEDSVMCAEVSMLRSAGHEVELLEADNRGITGPGAAVAAAGSLFWSRESHRRMMSLAKTFRPDILHIHNWFPLLSPSIVAAANSCGVPVVQTLHNFRMVCANAVLFRDGKVCHGCLGQAVPLGGVVHGCYAGSRVGSAVVTAAFAFHRAVETWNGVSKFIAVSAFQRGLLIRGGMDAAQIVVKPNFVKDTGGAGNGKGGYALFVGRLAEEKGIRTVLKAWREHGSLPPLKIMGDGPLVGEVRESVKGLRGVEFLGHCTAQQVAAAMAEARVVVFPSESYEPFALAIVEAFSVGTPVIGADLESIYELVEDGRTGLRFRAGDADDLAAKVLSIGRDGGAYRAMRRECRQVYEERYTSEINYRLLANIYESAIARTLERAS
jgi:glycosyltransferase involved in cell wall biosynthesis